MADESEAEIKELHVAAIGSIALTVQLSTFCLDKPPLEVALALTATLGSFTENVLLREDDPAPDWQIKNLALILGLMVARMEAHRERTKVIAKEAN